MIKTKKIPSQVDVLWDHVIVEGDTQDEVTTETFRLMEEAGNASFRPAAYRRADHKWFTVGEVMRPH